MYHGKEEGASGWFAATYINTATPIPYNIIIINHIDNQIPLSLVLPSEDIRSSLKNKNTFL